MSSSHTPARSWIIKLLGRYPDGLSLGSLDLTEALYHGIAIEDLQDVLLDLLDEGVIGESEQGVFHLRRPSVHVTKSGPKFRRSFNTTHLVK